MTWGGIVFKEVQKNQKLYMMVVDQIKELIDNGTLLIGEKLPSERDLSVDMGLSRSTIREAMTALDILGYVEVKPGLGTFVADRSHMENGWADSLEESDTISPTEIFEARLILEPQLARIASQRATIEELDELKRIVDEADKLHETEIEAFELLDEQFHMLIADAARNEVLSRFAQNINNLRKSKLFGSMKYESLKREGRISKYKIEHRLIYEAIQNRDYKESERLVRKHLTDIRSDIFEDII